ncbi:hypothetical protein RSSM_04434 [Rhodopirellula sallentina SM41]|uniref:Uncharacterized protein n=1 Tax=Rhodopirellula sallentina SM41 TaxID=1263870 RepID=M5TY54_9BACT|nr:hypothetical protein RSSM_04434 [Rhodopirellula sallentina SM41]
MHLWMHQLRESDEQTPFTELILLIADTFGNDALELLGEAIHERAIQAGIESSKSER